MTETSKRAAKQNTHDVTIRNATRPVADDIDALQARVAAGGAEITRPPHDTDYGSRDFALRDPEGDSGHSAPTAAARSTGDSPAASSVGGSVHVHLPADRLRSLAKGDPVTV
jgi:hypothetical protein